MNKSTFTSLAKLFNKNGFRLYMVGGTTRDYLLDLDILDYDFATDATPEEMKKFLLILIAYHLSLIAGLAQPGWVKKASKSVSVIFRGRPETI